MCQVDRSRHGLAPTTKLPAQQEFGWSGAVVSAVLWLAAILNPFTCLPALGYLLLRQLLYRKENGPSTRLPWLRDPLVLFQTVVGSANGHQTAAEGQQAAVGDQDCLWYFAFGANMNPQVLEGRRHVKPRKSLPCSVPGYTLVFSLKGFPYWEPAFGSIEAAAWRPPAAAQVAPAQRSSEAQAERDARDGRLPGALRRSLDHGLATEPTDASDGARARPASSRGDTAAGQPALPGASQQGAAPAPRRVAAEAHGAAMQQNGQHLAPDSLGPSGAVATVPTRPEERAAVTSAPREPRPVVHGVAHLVTRADWEQIKRTEGGGGHDDMGYGVEEVDCLAYDGQVVRALTLVAHPGSRLRESAGALPSARYLGHLVEGAAHSGLDPAYRAYLARLQPYRRASWRQAAGAVVTMAFFAGAGLPVLVPLSLARRAGMARERCQYATFWWVHQLITVAWRLHDAVLVRLFGSGCANV